MRSRSTIMTNLDWVFLVLPFIVGVAFSADDEHVAFCHSKLITLDGGLSDAQDNPCFLQTNQSPSDGAEYHSIFCQSPSSPSLQTTFHNYNMERCNQPIALHLYALSFPLNASIFLGFSDRLRVLTIKQWTPEGIAENCTVDKASSDTCGPLDLGQPFRDLSNLELLDIGFGDSTSGRVTVEEKFFEGPNSLQILQLENADFSALLKLDWADAYPKLLCVGFYEEKRNCSCALYDEVAALENLSRTLTTQGDVAEKKMVGEDTLTKTFYFCQVMVRCWRKDPSTGLMELVVFDENMAQTVCPRTTTPTSTLQIFSPTMEPSQSATPIPPSKALNQSNYAHGKYSMNISTATWISIIFTLLELLKA